MRKIGPSFVTLDGGESDTVLSGKVYGSVDATEALSVYGEVSFAGGVDGADNGLMEPRLVQPGPSDS